MMTSKKRNNILIGVIGAIGVGYLVLNKGKEAVDNFLSNVNMIYRGFSVDVEWTKFQVVFYIDYAIQNGNPTSVDNISYSGVVSYEGVRIGNVQTAMPVTLNADSTTDTQQLKLSVGITSLPGVIKDLILQGSFSNNITLNGVVSNGALSASTGDQRVRLFSTQNGLKAIRFIGMPMQRAA